MSDDDDDDVAALLNYAGSSDYDVIDISGGGGDGDGASSITLVAALEHVATSLDCDEPAESALYASLQRALDAARADAADQRRMATLGASLLDENQSLVTELVARRLDVAALRSEACDATAQLAAVKASLLEAVEHAQRSDVELETLALEKTRLAAALAESSARMRFLASRHDESERRVLELEDALQASERQRRDDDVAAAAAALRCRDVVATVPERSELPSHVDIALRVRDNKLMARVAELEGALVLAHATLNDRAARVAALEREVSLARQPALDSDSDDDDDGDARAPSIVASSSLAFELDSAFSVAAADVQAPCEQCEQTERACASRIAQSDAASVRLWAERLMALHGELDEAIANRAKLLRLLKRRVALDVEKRNVDDTAAAAAAAASVVDNSVARQLDRANAIIAAAQRRLGVERSVASHADTLVTNENDTDASRLHSAALIAVVKAVSFATRNVSDAALLAQQRGGAASLERPALNVAAATTHTVDLALSSATYDVTALRASIKGIDQAVAHMRVHATTHLRADAPTTRALNETCLELLERTRLLFEFVANDADATAAAAAAPPLPPSSVPASLRMYVQREYEAQERILRVEKELSDARLALARVRTDRYRSFGLSGK